MAPATAHLLGLPRELRDIIYSHLSRDIVLPWELNKDEKYAGECERVNVWLYDAPIAHVLRIHPQINAEYKEASCFKKLAAEVAIDLVVPIQDKTLAGSLTPLEHAVSHVRYATMIFDHVADPATSHGKEHQDTLQSLINSFIDWGTNLLVFKCAIQQLGLHHWRGATSQTVISHRRLLLGFEHLPADDRENFMPGPPDSLGDLTLLQRGDGYKLYYHSCWTKSYALRNVDLAPNILHDGDVVPFQKIAKIGIYMFGVGNVDKHFWEKEEVAELWELPSEYPEPVVFQPTSKEETEMVARLPWELREWKEKRGAELWPEEDEKAMEE
jgi:hypothetical protein